jgi:hypothetical protein
MPSWAVTPYVCSKDRRLGREDKVDVQKWRANRYIRRKYLGSAGYNFAQWMHENVARSQGEWRVSTRKSQLSCCIAAGQNTKRGLSSKSRIRRPRYADAVAPHSGKDLMKRVFCRGRKRPLDV